MATRPTVAVGEEEIQMAKTVVYTMNLMAITVCGAAMYSVSAAVIADAAEKASRFAESTARLRRRARVAAFSAAVSTRNFIWGNPADMQVSKLLRVEAFPGVEGSSDGGLGCDVTAAARNRLGFKGGDDVHLEGVPFNQVWRQLVKDEPEFKRERPGSLVVEYRDHWGDERRKVLVRGSAVNLPLEYDGRVNMAHLMSPGLSRVLISATEIRIQVPGEEEGDDPQITGPPAVKNVVLADGVVASRVAQRWIKNKAAFSHINAMHSVRDAIMELEELRPVRDHKEVACIKAEFLFSDMKTTTFEVRSMFRGGFTSFSL